MIDVHTILYAAVKQSRASADVWRHCKPKSLIPDHQDDDARQVWEKAAQEAISKRMELMESTLDGNHRRQDTESLWNNWSRAYEEGIMDAMDLPEHARRPYRGHGQVFFKKCPRQRLPEAIAEDTEDPANATCPPGGHLRDPHSASCTSAAARRVALIGTLATRQIRQGYIQWDREMPHHVRKLHAYLPAAMQRDTVHRIQSQRAPHALALLCKSEAARLKTQADALRETERRNRASEIRDALSDKKRG